MTRVLARGARLGRYEICNFIDAGGMGHVYRAKDTELKREVAIKILPPESANDPLRLARFKTEQQAIAQLKHPRVCTLFDVGCHADSEGDINYLVMEVCDGDTLDERLKKGALTNRDVLGYGIEIAEGLAAAHKRSIVHRDLKPANIKLTPSGVKLLDFGVAKFLTELATDPRVATQVGDELKMTKYGVRVGTPHYMSPEQVVGNDVDARTDVFAFGAVLFEMANGRKAFNGATEKDVFDAVLYSDPLGDRWGRTLSPFYRFLARCLSKDPSQRPRNGQALVDELIRIGRGQTLRFRFALIAALLLVSLFLAQLVDRIRNTPRNGFEAGTMGWGPHQYMDDRTRNAVQGVSPSKEQYRGGESSLRIDAAFNQTRNVGEVAKDIIVDSQLRDRGTPIDFSQTVLSAYVWFPDRFPVDGNHAPTARLFLKDDSLRSFYGCTENISRNNWIPLSLDTRMRSEIACETGQTVMDEGFDFAAVRIIGIQVAPNSEAPLDYTGHYFLDDVHWEPR